MWLLRNFLSRLIVDGSLGVIDAGGTTYRFGPNADHDDREPDVIIRLKSPSLYWKLALHPGLYLGEAYMDGTLELVRGDIWALLDLCGRNLNLANKTRRVMPHWLVQIGQAITQANSRRRSVANVAHHYDLSHALYATFLDTKWQYSCAYFPRPGISLDEAQEAKLQHIAAKLLIKPRQKLLDIGCGWGRLAMTMARHYGADVTGITLSKEQLADAQSAADEAGMRNVHFSLTDYRELKGTFDRIVSVGMFEHVGAPYYGAFFAKMADLLAPD
ncbi:MAG: cyclopropane-fatty-acyl-phospholipid synthase family protein, partial [Rhizomicrobium sp.]